MSEYLRILTLHAGKVSEPIRCTLRTVSFRDEPTYDALSYTWGDPTATKSIEVDGVAIEVTFNLEQALRHMRDAETDLVLWVDAVCINQSDIVEKSHQVALMGRIYSECAQVRIWLGCDITRCRLVRLSSPNNNEGNENVEGADPFGIVRMMASGGHIWDWPYFQDVCIHDGARNFAMAWNAFIAVPRSSWWTRMWTVQEAILPRTGLVFFDTWTTSLQTITNSGQNYQKHVWARCCPEDHFPDMVGNILREFSEQTYELYQDRKRDDNGVLELYFLEDQSVNYGFRECNDPRDKVYGLLGIVEDQGFTPDYTLSQEEVFFQATYRMISGGEGSLRCLAGPQYGPAPGKWASWVRHFDTPLSRIDGRNVHERCRLYESGLFYASDKRKSYPVLLSAPSRSTGELIDRRGLGLVGKRVGKVSSISERFDDGAISRADIIRRWFLDALSWGADDISAHFRAPSNTYKDADIVVGFWRTLLGGLDVSDGTVGKLGDFKKFTLATMHWLEDMLALLERHRELNAALLHIVCVVNEGRCYFKTENRGQGLCYPTTRLGDEVWVLYGGHVPFILRPAHLDEETKEALKPVDAEAFGGDEHLESHESRAFEQPSEGYYEFIGDCYFDGYMHGEAVRDSTIREESIVLV